MLSCRYIWFLKKTSALFYMGDIPPKTGWPTMTIWWQKWHTAHFLSNYTSARLSALYKEVHNGRKYLRYRISIWEQTLTAGWRPQTFNVCDIRPQLKPGARFMTLSADGRPPGCSWCVLKELVSEERKNSLFSFSLVKVNSFGDVSPIHTDCPKQEASLLFCSWCTWVNMHE